MIMDLGLKDKVALVVAASKGLGRASAYALAKEGAHIVIAARNQEVLEQTAQEIQRTTGGTVLALPTDLSQPDEIESLVTKAVETLGGIDILVNNAGGPPSGQFETLSDEQWQSAFNLNLLSAVRLIRAVLPSMKQRQGGRIIHIVSSSVKEPIAGLLLSNAIRPGVVGLAKTLSRELAPYQITVNNVCPGRILTDRLREGSSFRKKLAQGLTEEEALKDLAKDIPLGRIGRPEELGALVTFLASQQAAYITGTTIQIDGGSIQSLL
jgi:3-oxoacyl-[acyl-carrier protein] reductase